MLANVVFALRTRMTQIIWILRSMEFAIPELWFADFKSAGTEVGYKMPELKVQACGGEFTAHKVSVQTSSRGFAEEDFGLLGLDFLLSFERAVLNIQKMYLQVLK